MQFGVAYYPDYYHENEWTHDLEQIRAAGIERVRVGEFAWAKMEPDEGRFDLAWLERFLELARKEGVGVTLCTPTATPPAWLVRTYPEILPINRAGRRARFGGRQHRCYTSPVYRSRCRAVVGELAKRFARHPAVVAWQIDNEPGAEQKQCYCDECAARFRDRLEATYGSLDALNERWGTSFWSQRYDRWEDVPLPAQHGTDLPIRHHPSLELEFLRFTSDAVVEFVEMQASVIRAVSQEQPVTTNADSFTWGDNVDLPRLFRSLDVGGIDLYTNHRHEIAFYSDFLRDIDGERFWMLEYPAEGRALVEDVTITGVRGCEWFYLFKWKPFPWGQEQGMRDFLTVTGRPAPALERLREAAAAAVTSAPAERAATVGLVYDFASSWTMTLEAWDDDWRSRCTYQRRYIHELYAAAFEEGLPVRFCHDREAMAAHPLVVLPWLRIWSEDTERAVRSALEAGATVVATWDLFTRNRDNVFLTAVPELYRSAFGPEADFVYEGDATDRHEAVVGRGRLLLVSPRIGGDGWRSLLAALWKDRSV